MPDRGHHGPPQWRDGHPGPGPGTGLFRRLLGLVLLLVFFGPILGFLLSRMFFVLRTPHRWVVGGFLVLVLLGVVVIAGSRFGRSWRPIGDLIDATRRLGDGESGVRIPITQPGPLAAVSGSFNRMAARLEEEDERRRRLLADLGHELRTPLTVIRGEIEAVIDGVHDPASLANVIDEVQLMERLLEDLRVLTLTEAGRLQLHTEQIDIPTLVEDTVAAFAPVAEERGVRFDLDVEDGLDEIEADPYRLRQILANLTSNALNQMRDGGVVSIRVRREENTTSIVVSDTGPGIPPEQLPRIFERFVKGADSAGSGLGLSIARDLVEAHGGTITASNGTGGGAVFVITLPGTRTRT